MHRFIIAPCARAALVKVQHDGEELMIEVSLSELDRLERKAEAGARPLRRVLAAAATAAHSSQTRSSISDSRHGTQRAKHC